MLNGRAEVNRWQTNLRVAFGRDVDCSPACANGQDLAVLGCERMGADQLAARPIRKLIKCRVKASGCSTLEMCAASSITSRRASGSALAMTSEPETGVVGSWRPTRTSVGI